MKYMKIQVNVGIESSFMLKKIKIQVNFGMKLNVFSNSVALVADVTGREKGAFFPWKINCCQREQGDIY